MKKIIQNKNVCKHKGSKNHQIENVLKLHLADSSRSLNDGIYKTLDKKI